ncbi:MAG: LPS export ABC transporter permease LptF [Rhodobacterales bacterium CG18_big_fil_WC_8_21_14_2_50_71_9]|nr:MAG: LPS export ABC transporter permease LptF [Rhodobacterales bacterium CG18_big_fil_WC_8_21_14_2_50_71_9]
MPNRLRRRGQAGALATWERALITRYVLRELLKPFGFFLIVFTGVIWLTQSLRVIDTVVNSGQGAGVFLEFSALLLPAAMSIVMPIAAFAATLYTVNRLFADSEIVAMIAAGMSGVRLARPVALFGLAVMALMAVVTLWLAPLATREMRARVHDLRADIANALIFEGRFLHPAAGLTVYVRENTPGGEMLGVFVHDQRDPAAEVTYTARSALMARTDDGPRLVMYDGAAQRREMRDDSLSLLQFDSLVFDLSQFMNGDDARNPRPSERFIGDLLAPSAADLAATALSRLYAEGHDQLSGPLYALALPLIALAAIVGPGFSRSGYALRVAAAVALAVGLRMGGFAAKSAAAGAADLWPLLYGPPLLGVAAALWMLARRSPPGFARQRPTPGVQA